MNDRDKREQRREKREVKRLGGKLRRRLLKKALEENPAEAQHDSVGFGKLSSEPWNGLDRPSHRQGQDWNATEPDPD